LIHLLLVTGGEEVDSILYVFLISCLPEILVTIVVEVAVAEHAVSHIPGCLIKSNVIIESLV